jgi:hypothetical protein
LMKILKKSCTKFALSVIQNQGSHSSSE